MSKAHGERIVLFPTCLADLLFPEAAEAAERVLRRAGCEASFARGAVCCGQPAWNSGHVEEARKVARGALEALDGSDDPVVLCSGSCSTMVHEYWPQLFEGTPQEAAAKRVAARAREFSAFVAAAGPEALERLSVEPRTITYHHSCHMLRGLGIENAPTRLLEGIDGLELRPLAAPERCCGFGGTFSIRYPELAAAMADEKVDDAAARGAEEIVASDLGCLMHTCGRAEARGVKLVGRYIAEVLDEAMSASERGSAPGA